MVKYYIYQQQFMIPKTIAFLVFVILAFSLPPSPQEVTGAPGCAHQKIYSGFLGTTTQSRKIHYVFIAAEQNADKLPLTVWLNGGPGCSSLLGMLQQIGPCIVGNKYKVGDILTENHYSWNKASNLLFLESPAIVGFSTDNDYSHKYTDGQTANDAFAAIKDFIFTKSPDFKDRKLYLSGESYAGKYVPDISVRILDHNRINETHYIHLNGIIIGNGVMNFQRDSLTISQMVYMGQHQFLSRRIYMIYLASCVHDFNSPRCKYVRYEFNLLRNRINHYNVFQICKQAKSTEAAKLMQMLERNSENRETFYALYNETGKQQSIKEIIQCPNDDGVTAYWNLNKIAYHVENISKEWTPCASLHYEIDLKGSMEQYRQILLNKGVKVWLYSGDWDDQVPFPDTEKNLEILGQKIGMDWQSWFVNDRIAGFYHQVQHLNIITVKAGSHMVPQTNPSQSYQMFYNFINDRPINSTVPRME